ncbi:MAG: hypothetical protein JSV88_02930 [Candidatus Aminicenantes bacterium]|nr:MAG: hypothetical protein JSV88_02930 [Candidatus Aminicenantes bacterium]
MLKKTFLIFLCLFFVCNSGQLEFGQETDTAQHYILLLDATGSFTRNIGTKEYFSFAREMITNNSITQKGFLPYRPNQDIVSIVFFHFPIHQQSRKIIGKGIHTSGRLALIQGGINRRRSDLENFVENKREDFKKLAVSPIGLVEVTVLPFLNRYIKSLRTEFNRRIDKIYVISLSDEQYVYEEAGLTSVLRSFAYDSHKNYYSELRDYMQQNFESLVKIEYIEKQVPSISGGTSRVYFHYYQVKPRIMGVELKLTNKVALDRIARKSPGSQKSTMFWNGLNDVCLDNRTEYPAWVEWALAPSTDNGQWIWHRCDAEIQSTDDEQKVLSAGCRSLCSDNPQEPKPVVRIIKKETLWSTSEDVKRFKQEIWYRGVVDINNKNDSYSYPFNYRCYLAPQKVEYTSNEVSDIGESKVPDYYEYNMAWYNPLNLRGLIPFLGSWVKKSEITDDLLKKKVEDEKFCLLVKGYINKEKFSTPFKDYCDAFKDKTITELPAEVLSETSKIHANNSENWAKWGTFFFYAFLIASIFFVNRYIVRPVEIRFNIDGATKHNNTIPVDFSNPRTDKEVLAVFALENIIYTFHPLKKNPTLKLFFDIQWEFASGHNVELDADNLLEILNIEKASEHKLQKSQAAQTGNLYYVTIPDVHFKQKFNIMLNLAAIKDLDTPHIGDTDIDFSFTLKLPQVIGTGGKELPISSIKSGIKEYKKVWKYDITLKFKPETREKEILFKPEQNIFTTGAPTAPNDPAAVKQEDYALDFTSKKSMAKLFHIEIKNPNTHQFSYGVDGKFSIKVRETGKAVPNIFYLSENPVHTTKQEVFREIPIRLKKPNTQKDLSLYIDFDEFPNLVYYSNYTISCYFDDKIFKALNLRINRSKEETEALVQLIDEDQPVPLNTPDNKKITQNITIDNWLLAHQGSKDLIPVKLKIPGDGKPEKGIKEVGETKLFDLVLKNNCNTKTGFYNWEIKNVTVIGNNRIKFDEKAVNLVPDKNSGRIEDSKDSIEEIEFCLDYTKVRDLCSYHFDFILKFTLCIHLFPQGKPKDKSPTTEADVLLKQMDFTITFDCFHDVKDNYLVIDFGTSAICAFFHTQYLDSSGSNYFQIPFESPPDSIPSEEHLLPSIVNLRNTAKGNEIIRKNDDEATKLAEAGSEHFIDLPALNDIFGLCPDSVLNSIKLLIVQGIKVIPIPEKIDFGFEKRDFLYINEDGKPKKGYPSLSSVLKSCYEHLLKSYIEKGDQQSNSTGKNQSNKSREEDSRRYRKLVLTHPNVYNNSHISFLKEHVFREVFQEPGRAYFENITLESESNCVLYYYLLKRTGPDYLAKQNEKDVPGEENVLIIDIGAGTLDISYARVKWKKEMEVVTPADIEVIKRDGIAMAGDALDKAIALQVHDLLKGFNEFEDFKYTNQIASMDDRGLDSKRKLDLKKIMFAFKITHILAFKKDMSARDEDEIVDICLGDNSEKAGLGEIVVESLENTINQGQSITVKLINRYGKLYLGMKKKEWLSMPYLQRFKQLLIDKLKAFTTQLTIPSDLNIVLSGRTSLWPDVRKAVTNVFDKNKNIEIADDIWPQDAYKKAIELKRSVILGAIQKATTWKQVAFKETSISGVEALRYQKGTDGFNPKSWEIKTFNQNSPIHVNLANSSYFELGIKTSLDFVPLIGADGYKRDHYCERDKKVEITLEKMTDGKSYNFYVKTDKFKKGKGTRLRQVLSHETAFLRTKSRYWPVHEVQLWEIPPEQFNENT